jgi:hypothetical protein
MDDRRIVKAASPQAARSAVVALGVSERLARPAVACATLGEWLIAVGVTMAPRSSLVTAAVIAVFLGFALLGVWALVQTREVRWGCFGSLGSAKLGSAQLCQFVGVTAVAVWIQREGPQWTWPQSLGVLLLVHVAAPRLF